MLHPSKPHDNQIGPGWLFGVVPIKTADGFRRGGGSDSGIPAEVAANTVATREAVNIH